MQFKDIQGQQKISNQLTEIIDSGRVSHAQLFLGSTINGSLALAIAYAQYLNCQHRIHYNTIFDKPKGGPACSSMPRQENDCYEETNSNSEKLRADSCGQCPNCRKFDQLIHSDLHFIFPNANNDSVKSQPSSADFQEEFRNFLLNKRQIGTIDEWYSTLNIENKQGIIREKDADNIVKTLSLKSYEGAYKTVIVWMAEKMNPTAANKLLKTLEEPSPNTLILLVAENTDRMLSTILSRLQVVRIPHNNAVTNWPSDFYTTFVSWMRLLFKLNMQRLSDQVDQLAAMKREQQKQFLLFSLETIRQCFLNTAAGLPCHLHSGDEKFDNAFPSMITLRNIEQMSTAVNDILYALERNASPKIAFMQLSFTISKLIKNR